MYLQTPYKISYDTKKYDFRKIVSEMLEVWEGDTIPLEDLHTLEHYELLVREKDQSTIWHKRYYQKYKEQFLPTYLELVKELKERFGYDEIIYQVIPTFRVQLAEGNLGVGEWHKDKSYNHGTSEVNFWMPFVNTNEQNTIWMESKEDKGDYKPYEVKYGEILVFSGANLIHGNKNNDSSQTRVSVDFRLVDPNKFIPNEAGSINMKTKFDVGGYFEKI
jgi:ectoine hydroxylase-related dioxygenase (phytanoyl-CoA dioxygenase family)